MKLKLTYAIASFLLLTSVAHAGGVQCQVDGTCGNSFEQPENFCINDNGHIHGWGFHGGYAYITDKTAGMPDPTIAFKVVATANAQSFYIHKIHRYTGAVIQVLGPFYHLDDQTILFGESTVFSKAICN